MLGLLPTGFGKSLIFQLYPRIFELVNGRKNCHVVIVSALNAITEEQVQELADIGISAVAFGDSRGTDENYTKRRIQVGVWQCRNVAEELQEVPPEIFWKLLDFEKYVYVRITNSITAIVAEWIFYGLPLFTGFDFHKITGFC